MSRLRLLLFWLLILVVPLQGFAATSKLPCGGLRHASQEANTGMGGLVHPPSHHHAHADTSGPDLLDMPAIGTEAIDARSHQCGLCAACCHVIGIAVSVQPVLLAPVPPADLPDRVERIATLELKLPRKPPRA
jgi:hypothetical protein